MSEIVLEMKDIYKSFGPVSVLKGVNLTLHKGEVLGLIGENGAGKSTLIKILCGIYRATSGEIFLNGEKVEIHSAEAAQKLGISTIYQELSVIPDLNAVQNIFLNRELTGRKNLVSKLKYKEMRQIAEDILFQQLKVQMNAQTPLKYVPLAQKQMVEIARTVYANAQIIIMDEPTASLQAAERDKLFHVIRGLKEKGHSIIFISHHLDELLEICDTITILRDGQKVDEGPVPEFTIDRIIADMVGKELKNKYPKHPVPIGDVLMEAENLSDGKVFRDISFQLHRGEILGIVGLEGCGKNEVIRAIFGDRKLTSGMVRLAGKKYCNTIKGAMKAGIAFLPAERKVEGLFLKQDLAWNISIASLSKICRFRTLVKRNENGISDGFIERLNIKCTGHSQNISALSGGNQQKVMLSRWIMTDADVLLLEEPTRGIDVNAKTEVYETIGKCVAEQKGVIVVSSEEEEVLGICDQILVMKDGRVSAVLSAGNTTTEEIKQYSV
ncbi:MAG: sugar ABC transporter ATP-binding protein [Enterocloster sp.]